MTTQKSIEPNDLFSNLNRMSEVRLVKTIHQNGSNRMLLILKDGLDHYFKAVLASIPEVGLNGSNVVAMGKFGLTTMELSESDYIEYQINKPGE